MHAEAVTRQAEPVTGDGGFDAATGLSFTLAGVEVFAHYSGILFLPREKTLIVADLHLEKGSCLAKKQVFLPPYDTTATLARLAQAMTMFQPDCVVALGDSFHDEEGPDRLGIADAELLHELVSSRRWCWISGNHDPSLPVYLGGDFLDEICLGPLTLRHEPKAEADSGEISGHLHPCARVRGRGRSVRSRCFVANSTRLIMPAFGAFTGGLNVRDAAFRPFFSDSHYHAYMMGSGKLFPIADTSCLPG